jgi:hypothetical protein
MKKILTSNEKAKKGKFNQIILGFFLIAIMLFSTLGYALGGKEAKDSKEVIQYKDIEFTRTTGYWNFNLNNQEFNTLFNPEELIDIQAPIQTNLQNYNQQPLYLVGGITESSLEIIRNLNPFLLRVNNACLSEVDCNGDFPIKNQSTDNILIIQEPSEDEEERIYQQEKAIFIIASTENQTRYVDAVFFKILGI